MSDENQTEESGSAGNDIETLRKELDEARKAIEALNAKKDELLGETKAERQKRREYEESARKAAEDAAKKTGDIEALEKSWQDKLTKREKELLDEREGLSNVVRDLTVKATATKLAAELAVPGSADVLLPHIKSRLSLEMVDGRPTVRVLDANGKPSAMTPDELAKEVAAMPAFAPVIVASKATGGGATGSRGGGAAVSTISRSAFDSLAPEAKLAHIKSGGNITD